MQNWWRFNRRKRQSTARGTSHDHYRHHHLSYLYQFRFRLWVRLKQRKKVSSFSSLVANGATVVCGRVCKCPATAKNCYQTKPTKLVQMIFGFRSSFFSCALNLAFSSSRRENRLKHFLARLRSVFWIQIVKLLHHYLITSNLFTIALVCFLFPFFVLLSAF